MKKFALLAAVALAGLSAQAATLTVELNSDRLTINNQAGDDIVLLRTASTPKKVKIDFNPRVEYRQVCVEQDVHQACGYNRFQCGATAIRRCTPWGQCHIEYRPRYCCWTQVFCRRYEDVPYTTYGDITLKFKDNLMQPGETDEFALVPLSQDQAELRVIKSARPYQIKTNGDRDGFTLSQK